MKLGANEVMLATGEVVDADLELIGAKSIANAWGMSVGNFKRIVGDGIAHPKGRGIYLTPDLMPKIMKRGIEVYCLTAWRAMQLYSSEVEMASERPDAEFNPADHTIVGKAAASRTRPSDLDASLRKSLRNPKRKAKAKKAGKQKSRAAPVVEERARR